MSASHYTDPFIGQIILDDYHILKKLGSGGMGSVYLAKQTSLDRYVAVKILNTQQSAQQHILIERFNREARLASSLEHPNIVKIYQFGNMPDGTLFLIMEYVHGISLRDKIAQGLIPQHTALEILIQISDALSLAHQKHLIHRDLKPDNIMLREQRGHIQATLLDFGIAKSISDDAENLSLTQTGMVFGTPNYMSPEQAKGINVTEKADMYSLGAVAYQMLTGALPISAPTPVAQLLALAIQEPTPIQEHKNIQLHKKTQALIMRMLAKDPLQRPESMAAVTDEARHILIQLQNVAGLTQKQWLILIAILVTTTTGLILFTKPWQKQENTQQAWKDAGQTQIFSQKIDASQPQKPDFANNLGLSIQSPEVWSLNILAPFQPSPEKGKQELIRSAIETIFYALLQNQTQIPNLEQAVKIPIVSSRTQIISNLAARSDEGDIASIRQITKNIELKYEATFKLLEPLILPALEQSFFYWEKIIETDSHTHEKRIGFDCYQNFTIHLDKIKFSKYQKVYTANQIGISTINFLPMLIWAHDSQSGVVVVNIEKNSPAEKSGIKLGDVIVAWSGEPVRSLDDFEKMSTITEKHFQQQQGATVMIVRKNQTIPIALRAP